MKTDLDLPDTLQDLYFIENPRFSMIKIGVSNDVSKRCYTLSLACGVELTVLRVVKRGALYELPLHRAFHAVRQYGEWFSATDQLRALAVSTERVDLWLKRNEALVDEGRRLATEQYAAINAERAARALKSRNAERVRVLKLQLGARKGFARSMEGKRHAMSHTPGLFTGLDAMKLQNALDDVARIEAELQELAA